MDIESAVVVTDGRQWQKELPDLGDLEVLVAPWDNAAFERAMQKGVRALPAGLRADGNVEPAAYNRVLGKVMATSILFDWKNLKIGGVEKPFDRALAEQYLTDQKYRPFRDGIIAAAKRVQMGAVAEEDTIVGNSSASSPGSETGEASPTG